MKQVNIGIGILLAIAVHSTDGIEIDTQRVSKFRSLQQVVYTTNSVSANGLCPTMIPPSPLAPDDSSCWKWWDPPSNGVLSPGTVPPKGCNYKPCQDAVCNCDDYCCNTAWDLSCRGYAYSQGDASKNNYFVDGCSAKMLCCEQESAFPDPPIGGAGSISVTKINVSGGSMSGETASGGMVSYGSMQGGSIQGGSMSGSMSGGSMSGGMSGGSMSGGSMSGSGSISMSSLDTRYQCTPGSPGCCSTMIPPSFLAPDDSTCWQWWDPPSNGVLPAGTVPPKGCNYKPCQDAVCACDDYCCNTAWDISCRGYYSAQGDGNQNNYFVEGCSAKMLCCEQESAYPDPPIGGAVSINKVSMTGEKITVSGGSGGSIQGGSINISGGSASGGSMQGGSINMNMVGASLDTRYQCTPGSPGCCSTMIPPSFLAPDDSTCWQWWDPPSNGVLPAGTVPPKGCNYKPCQDAVCNCDDYCCTTAWDLSCRGYHLQPGDTIDNNYFVDGCSAKILCCEQESAFPDPPIGGAQQEIQGTIEYIPVPTPPKFGPKIFNPPPVAFPVPQVFPVAAPAAPPVELNIEVFSPTQTTKTTAIILCDNSGKSGKKGDGLYPCTTTKGVKGYSGKSGGKGGKHGGVSDYAGKKGSYGDNAFAVPVTTTVIGAGQVQYAHASGKGGSSQQVVQVVPVVAAQQTQQVQYVYTSGKGGKGG